jgi:hypothetical protein
MSYGADEFETLVSRVREALQMSESAGGRSQVRAIRIALLDGANAAHKRGNLEGSACLLGAAMALRALDERRADEVID